MNTKALREQRKKLAEDANAILAKAVAEGRAASPEEIQQVDRMHADIDALKATIDRAERSESESRAIVPESQRETREADPQAEARAREIRSFFRPSDEQRNLPASLTLGFENRAQTVGTGSSGGYTVAQAFSNRLEEAMKFFGGMLNVAEIITTETGADMPWPTVNDTAQSGAILAENTGVSNQDLVFSSVTMKAYKYSSKQILVPVELLQDSAFDVDGLVARKLGERVGRILNTHFTTGTGTAQPNGVVTASTLGKTGANGQTTTVIFDDLIDLIHSVDVAYRGQAKWMTSDANLKVIRKLKDSQNRPLWEPSVQAGQPDRLLGYDVVINNDIPAMAASAKSILFGDFSNYKVRRVKDITLLRLVERYAESHQVGFLAFARFDGNLIDAGTNPVKHYANSAT